MFFQKSIISLFAAIALATSISASSIALRDYPQCPSGLSPYCCTQAIPFSSLSDGPKTALPGAASDLDQSKPVCLGGAAPPAQGCPSGTTPECCPSIVTADGQTIAYNCQDPNNGGQDASSVATGQQAGQPNGGSNKDPNGAKNGAQH